jgi:hypothetical protein
MQTWCRDDQFPYPLPMGPTSRRGKRRRVTGHVG